MVVEGGLGYQWLICLTKNHVASCVCLFLYMIIGGVVLLFPWLWLQSVFIDYHFLGIYIQGNWQQAGAKLNINSVRNSKEIVSKWLLNFYFLWNILKLHLKLNNFLKNKCFYLINSLKVTKLLLWTLWLLKFHFLWDVLKLQTKSKKFIWFND